jgi:hypothetical protein
VENSPSSIARVDAYEDILALLVDPTPDKFTQARITYALDEGLESRVVRREDLHYPPIPESDWEPGVDADKQCSVIENAQKYPERCAGPARIAPILNEAFAAGQSGEEELAVHAARIDAALLWFFYISVFKEANTCALLAPKDCDSSWAYYSGGTQRSDGHGFAAQLLNIDHQAHHAIFDGILAFRCWRELHAFVEGEEPTPEAQQLLDDATAQLDDALVHGYAIIVRAHLERQARVCELSARANWAYLQIAGPALEFHGRARDPALYGELAAIWQLDEPMAVDIERAVEIIDTLFTCPRHAS